MPYVDKVREKARAKEREREQLALTGTTKKREKAKRQAKRQRAKLKKAAIDAYGGHCQCCKEAEIEFLTIDHINGGGNAHRREVGFNGSLSFYRWLHKSDYPPGFQTLCHNCNFSKRIGGVCFHQR